MEDVARLGFSREESDHYLVNILPRPVMTHCADTLYLTTMMDVLWL